MLTKTLSLRPIAIWLIIGVIMIMIQVMLGGITRLTGSGLSITSWDLITGSLPPTNHTEWEVAFSGYKQTEQYKQINSTFELADFKYIYFWEWFHRVWARIIGIVFMIPFLIFLWQRRFQKWMIQPLVLLFILGGLQGIVGWLMVSTGLHNSKLLYVRHYELATHLMLALLVLAYTFWFALKILIKDQAISIIKPLHKISVSVLLVLAIQLVYGAFMAGLKAGTFAPTWPQINSSYIPNQAILFKKIPIVLNLLENEIMIQLIHRGLAYILFLLIAYWTFKAYQIKAASKLFISSRWIPLATVSLQLLLGIFTVLNSGIKMDLLWLGVSHQFVAMLLLLVMVWQLYIERASDPTVV